MHLVMAEYYIPGKKRGRPLLETWDEFTKESFETIRVQSDFSEEARAEYVDAKELGISMLEEYEKYFGGDPHWEVISPEQRFNTQIPDLRDKHKGKPIAQVVGTYDLVIRDLNDGHVKMVDHKTCASCPKDMRFLNMDGQCSTYLTVGTHSLRQMGLIGPKETIKGMEYNFLAKRKPDERPINARGMACNKPIKKHYVEAIVNHFGQDEPAGSELLDEKAWMKETLAGLEALAKTHGLTVFGDESKLLATPTLLRHYVARTPADRNRQIRHMANEAAVMKQFDSGKLPIYKNPTKECTWCDFFDLCEIDEAGGDAEDFKAIAFKKQDPYADHRDGAFNSKTSVGEDRVRKA